jgi:hypothetical protein
MPEAEESWVAVRKADKSVRLLKEEIAKKVELIEIWKTWAKY